MIDTKKYEGHAPGPWTVFIDDDSDETYLQIEGPTHTIAYDVGRGLDEREGPNVQTAHVIADAPLLLAEVKRLRKSESDLLRAMSQYEELIRKMKELIE